METIKTVLAVTGLVLIGFIGGFYAHRQMSMHFIHNVVEMRQPKGFQEQFFKRANISEEQQGKIQPIVEGYSNRLGQLHRKFRENRHLLIDSMHAEIKPHLLPEQIERMERFSRRFKEGEKKMRKRFKDREKKPE